MKYAIIKKKIAKTDSPRMNLPVLLGVIMAVLLIIQVVVSNRLATTGEKVSQIEEEIQTLTAANIQITEQVASASALVTLKSKAVSLGFTKKVTPVYLSPDLPVARVLP